MRTRAGRVRRRVRRPAPTEEELKFFGLSKNSLAVIEHIRTAFDQNGEPFRLTVTVYKPGTNKIRFIAGDVPDEVWERGS